MVSGRVFVVFILPIILSVTLATAVMADVLDKPGRSLQMWPPPQSGGHGSHDNLPVDTGIDITGLPESHPVGEQLSLRIIVSDVSFDCGDLYVTLLNEDETVLTQGAFFTQCFAESGIDLPAGDNFAVSIDTPGHYTIVAEMRSEQGVISTLGEFVVE